MNRHPRFLLQPDCPIYALFTESSSAAMSNHAASSPARHTVPAIVNRKVPIRRKNTEYRNREYLSEKEVGQVIDAAAGAGRHRLRDATLILLAYRHGLRVSELVALRWDQVDLTQGLVHISRRKNGVPSVHPLRGPELRALRRLERDYPETPYLFVSERKAPLTADTVRKIVARAGQHAGIEFPIASQYPAHDPVHGIGGGPVQKFLAGLNARRWPRGQFDVGLE